MDRQRDYRVILTRGVWQRSFGGSRDVVGKKIASIMRPATRSKIRVTVRKVWVSMASRYPWQELYGQVWANLRC